MTGTESPEVKGAVEELEKVLRWAAPEWSTGKYVRTILTAYQERGAEIERLEGLVARLRQEAEIHAGEARAHKASLHEAYQAVTGATGEPGNWNGAEPIRAFVSTARDRIAALEEELRRMQVHTKWPSGGTLYDARHRLDTIAEIIARTLSHTEEADRG